MKIEVDVIIEYLATERKRLRKELIEADENRWKGKRAVLQGGLAEINKAIKALKEYRGDVDE